MDMHTKGSAQADQTEQPTLKLVDLAQDGDVILAAESPPTNGVKVSASRLTEMSLVFERMLNGSFAEGQVNRSSADPQQVALPGDDAKGVSDLCHLLYHEIDDLDDAPLSVRRLYQLIKVADRYDCVDKLRRQAASPIEDVDAAAPRRPDPV